MGKESRERDKHVGVFTFWFKLWKAKIITLLPFGHLMIYYWSARVAIAQTTWSSCPKPTVSLGVNVGKERRDREKHMGAFIFLVLNSSNKWNATIITLLHFGHLMIYWSSIVAVAQTTDPSCPKPTGRQGCYVVKESREHEKHMGAFTFLA